LESIKIYNNNGFNLTIPVSISKQPIELPKKVASFFKGVLTLADRKILIDNSCIVSIVSDEQRAIEVTARINSNGRPAPMIRPVVQQEVKQQEIKQNRRGPKSKSTTVVNEVIKTLEVPKDNSVLNKALDSINIG
jgi:hypothetical protein